MGKTNPPKATLPRPFAGAFLFQKTDYGTNIRASDNTVIYSGGEIQGSLFGGVIAQGETGTSTGNDGEASSYANNKLR